MKCGLGGVLSGLGVVMLGTWYFLAKIGGKLRWLWLGYEWDGQFCIVGNHKFVH